MAIFLNPNFDPKNHSCDKKKGKQTKAQAMRLSVKLFFLFMPPSPPVIKQRNTKLSLSKTLEIFIFVRRKK